MKKFHATGATVFLTLLLLLLLSEEDVSAFTRHDNQRLPPPTKTTAADAVTAPYTARVKHLGATDETRRNDEKNRGQGLVKRLGDSLSFHGGLITVV